MFLLVMLYLRSLLEPFFPLHNKQAASCAAKQLVAMEKLHRAGYQYQLHMKNSHLES